MNLLTTSRNRNRLAYRLVWLFLAIMISFWSWEFKQSLGELDQRQDQLLIAHQQQLLERKSEELSNLFQAIYQSARTMALLPMVREIKGDNRQDKSEDIVAQGRFSLDAHRTLQQIYTNLVNNIRISEVYYVLDGFQPDRQVPFFMYDDQIAGISQPHAGIQVSSSTDMPEEIETFEYRHFPVQLAWFRKNAPNFRWSENLNEIPVRLSPMLRTCDNSQYLSRESGNEREALGLIYAMPVYDADTAKFKGMITIILRSNVLEARLIGIPYLPLTPAERLRQTSEGWQMPEPTSFRLEQAEYGIAIYDRRHPNAAHSPHQTQPESRTTALSIALGTGQPWQLSHTLSAGEIAQLTEPIAQERRWTILGRISLLVVMCSITIWSILMLRRSQGELLAMANYDGLTALPNRRFFFEHLQQAINRSKRTHRKVALLFMDISNFKSINDTYGHHGGDALLVDIARRLQETLRDTDVVDRLTPGAAPQQASASRLGGDEFVVICEDFYNTDDIPPMADRLMSALRQVFWVEGEEVRISACMGVAIYPDDASDSNKLMQCADIAMHESRQNEGHYLFFNEELRQRSERMHTLSAELALALERGQFELFYQPKASLHDGHIVSLEALLRWRHPKLGNIPPNEFIPILESKGGILEVGEWVIEQACLDLARLDELGFTTMALSVNVSVRQLRHPNFHHTVSEILLRTGTKPQRLILEITESMVMENLEEGRQALLRLQEIGTPLAIDDFGTGYSSLTYLQQLPLDYLKLDKGFIDGMSNPRVKHIVETVIHLAHGLSLKTIAEGIETVEQRDAVTAFGCDIMQGYLLSRPLPLPEIIEWMKLQSIGASDDRSAQNCTNTIPASTLTG